MTELSLYALDIAQNSLAAGATQVRISVRTDTDGDAVVLTVEDNGRGMTAEAAALALSPFATGRASRRVGLGLPLLRQAAEQTGGGISIQSTPGKGTCVKAVFKPSSVDCPPLGKMGDTILLLVQQRPQLELIYRRQRDGAGFTLDTREMAGWLKEVRPDHPQVLAFIQEYITENEYELGKGMK